MCFGHAKKFVYKQDLINFIIMHIPNDSEFLMLQAIRDHAEREVSVSQRDLARAIEMSIGMTNTLLRRLTEKGFVWVHKINARNMSYALTSEGLAELTRRTNRYLKRTMKHVVRYKELILRITTEAKARGFTRIGLLGSSDIDFVIEWAANARGLDFKHYDTRRLISQDTFVFVGDSVEGFAPSQRTPLQGDYELAGTAEMPAGGLTGKEVALSVALAQEAQEI